MQPAARGLRPKQPYMLLAGHGANRNPGWKALHTIPEAKGPRDTGTESSGTAMETPCIRALSDETVLQMGCFPKGVSRCLHPQKLCRAGNVVLDWGGKRPLKYCVG